MSHIFISYSRKDINIAEKIVDTLAKNELETWIDWKSIPKGEDWEQEIYQGIEEADAFLFLISPDSAKSEMCNKEIAHAVKNHKRVLPIVIRDTDIKIFLYELANKEISKRNWVFCRQEQDNFDKAIEDIQTTIHTDYVWLKYHTRLQIKALEWERNHKENSFLLRGKDLQDGELQLATNSSKEPYPTDLHLEYVSTSRSVEDMQHRSSRQRRNVASAIGVVLLITIVLATTGKLNRFIYRPVDMEDYWVTIPAGEFQMGSSDKEIAYAKNLCPECDLSNEQPQHSVFLDEYQIGTYEVTNRQYVQCVKAGICSTPVNKIYATQKYELHPVTNVNWYDANTYCGWAGGRLPTQAEWEKAARGGLVGKAYPWGDEAPTCTEGAPNGANFGGEGCPNQTMPVGRFSSNAYGLYDIAGNVFEWIADWDDVNPGGNTSISTDIGQTLIVLRGGTWVYNDFYVRSASRVEYAYGPWYADYSIGFRCSRSP